MKPQDLEGLRELRHEASLAVQAADNFEKEKSVPPEGSEALTPTERFENVWNYLQGVADPLSSPTSAKYARTFTRLVHVQRENGYSEYALNLFFSNEIEGRRVIGTAWTHHRSVEDGVAHEGGYTHRELFTEDHLKRNVQLEQLANIETSITAFDDAMPFAEELWVQSGGTLPQ